MFYIKIRFQQQIIIAGRSKDLKIISQKTLKFYYKAWIRLTEGQFKEIPCPTVRQTTIWRRLDLRHPEFIRELHHTAQQVKFCFLILFNMSQKRKHSYRDCKALIYF